MRGHKRYRNRKRRIKRNRPGGSGAGTGGGTKREGLITTEAKILIDKYDGIDPSKITPTGGEGYLTESDVLKYIQANGLIPKDKGTGAIPEGIAPATGSGSGEVVTPIVVEVPADKGEANKDEL